MNILGICRFCGHFFFFEGGGGGGVGVITKSGLYLGVISWHFIVFS